MSSTHQPIGLTDAQHAFRRAFEMVAAAPPEVGRYHWMLRNPEAASKLLHLMTDDKADLNGFGAMLDRLISAEQSARRRAGD